MSRAEITRMSSRRTVNATNSSRSRLVRPIAQYLFSPFEWPGSDRTTNGSWKKMSSASSGVTRCRSQFFVALSSSQSKPMHSASGSFAAIFCIYHTYTKVAIQLPGGRACLKSSKTASSDTSNTGTASKRASPRCPASAAPGLCRRSGRCRIPGECAGC